MIFLSGSTFLSCDEMSVPCSPTNIKDITKITLSNAWFDDLYVSENTEIGYTEDVPTDWDFDTIMHAYFDNTAAAGNMNWSLLTTSHIIIKRKLNEDFRWMTVKVKEIHDYDDFEISGIDITPGNGIYNYAVVPITAGTIEGTYSKAKDLEVKLDRLVFIDTTGIWHTSFLDSFDIQYVVPSAAVETLNERYPFIVSNTNANYRTITMTTKFFPGDDIQDCDHPDGEHTDGKSKLDGVKYRDAFFEFLHNRKAKLLKTPTGRVMLVYCTTPASLTIGETEEIEDINLGVTEVGDPKKEETLWYAGLLDSSVTEEWWNM